MSLLQEHLHLDEVTGAITITDSRLFDREAQEGERSIPDVNIWNFSKDRGMLSLGEGGFYSGPIRESVRYSTVL